MAGKICVVTGGGSGIGRCTAQLFSLEGATGVLVSDLDLEAAEETANDINRSRGGVAIACSCDVACEEEVIRMMQQCVDTFGTIDVVFANAGTTGKSPASSLLDLEVDDWDLCHRVNTRGAFLCIKHAALHMKDNGHGRGGSVVVTASVAGLRAGAGNCAYSASKAAAINLVSTAAHQLGFCEDGKVVRVNAVCPGLIETGMTGALFEMARQRGTEGRIGQLNPLRRSGEPEEIAQAVVFLSSEHSSYINGQALSADGGLSASLPVSRPGAVA
jgi:NAD(P)-dependent dehydrogenase (short-subunit alcohol dehydrogenase family)